LLPSKAAVKVGSWSPDGKIIAYSLGDPLFESESRIWTMPADGEGDATAFSHDKTIERNGMISPDGRWMAYSAREAGRFDVFVTSFPDSSGKWQVSRAGGMEPRWSRDGSEIFFRTPDNALMAATVNGKGATFEVNDVRPLFRTNMKHSFHAYVPTADSQRFLLNWVGEKESATPFALVQNWPAALKK
jgi:Tol biopolymer transport system component